MTKTVFIGLGANLGNREAALTRALSALKELFGMQAWRASSFYETTPVGGNGPDYLNAVCSFETSLCADEMHDVLIRLEQEAGRERSVKNAPRTLDLDLLFYGADNIANERLTVPHPRLVTRAFVLVPLCEIAPDWIHPLLKKTIKQLLEELPQSQMEGVKKYEANSICQTISSNA